MAASTLTSIAVFFPMVFVEGIAGQLFGDLGLTVVFSLLASLAVALFFIPMISSRQWAQPGGLTGDDEIEVSISVRVAERDRGRPGARDRDAHPAEASRAISEINAELISGAVGDRDICEPISVHVSQREAAIDCANGEDQALRDLEVCASIAKPELNL